MRIVSTIQRYWRQIARVHHFITMLHRLGDAPISRLLDETFVANEIRDVGLVFDSRTPYGADNVYMGRAADGLWQMPMQLARCLVELSNYDIKSIIEIGTWSGWTISFVTAYLLRFNPLLHSSTVDTGAGFGLVDAVARSLPIQFHVGTAARFKGTVFDLALIDGDHSYDAVGADFDVVGKPAGLCVIHNINDKYVEQNHLNNGGAPRLWRELKVSARDSEFCEFIDHSAGDRVMGLGLIISTSARRRSTSLLSHSEVSPSASSDLKIYTGAARNRTLQI